MFSPYYAWSGWRAPENHCALNVALYGRRKLWAMTERGAGDVVRDASAFAIGPSVLRADGDDFVVDVHEWAAPLPAPMRGRVRLTPRWLADRTFVLDAHRRHHWRPIAPRARIEVEFSHPALRWRGEAYMDCNWGSEPLERAFSGWNWSRAHAGAETFVYYDTAALTGAPLALAHCFRSDGIESVSPPAQQRLPRTFWGIERRVRADGPLQVNATLEDAPFYARSALTTPAADIVHESLSLTRLASPIVRAMLPFRMPRIARRR